MADGRLIDQWGNPLSTARQMPRPMQEFAAPAMGSVRSVWTQTIVSGLDPVGLAEILRQAANGYPDRFFALAEEMEERDLHYGSVLGTRKRAITGIEPIVVAASEDAEDEKLAEDVRELIKHPGFTDDYVDDLLDGIPKGYAIVETIWDRAGRRWWPDAFKRRDPRHFLIDRIDGRTLRMKDSSTIVGLDLPPFVFSIHRPKLKSGLPIRGGLARLAAWAFLFKHYTLKDWMAFLEVYGMPLRVGKFGRGSSHEDRRILLQAVRDLSTDAAAIIPKEMEIEFLEVSGGTGNGLFSAKAEYLDKQISKGVLGQTMSTDDGASLSQAQVHENVRHDIGRADARQVAVTINRDLIRPYVDFNYGPRDRYPTVVIPIVESEDIKALAEVIARLVPLGLEVGMADVRRRVGFEDPDEDDVILVAPNAAADGAADEEQHDAAEAERRKPAGRKRAARKSEAENSGQAGMRPACPDCGKRHATAADQRDALDELVDDALEDWELDLAPIFRPLKALFERASSYQDLVAGLEDLSAKVDVGPITDKLAKLGMKARGLGDTGEGR